MDGINLIIRRFVTATILISIFLLIVNAVLLGTLVFREINHKPSPENVLRQVAEGLAKQHGDYLLDVDAERLLKDNQSWAMLLDESGQVQWGYLLPDDVPRSYNLVDIAKFSRYYLMEYPVYVWEHKDGLVVIGYPKESHWKYELNFYSDWVSSLPIRFMLLLIVNVALALLVSILIGMRLLRGIRPLVEGVHQLAREENVKLDSKGLFGDLAYSINCTSDKLQKKTSALKTRDEARSNWIAGISHDIRTPLSMILGYASEMEHSSELSEEQRYQAGIIRRQSEKLRSLVSDLNLVSMLEYEMQPLQIESIRLSVLAREVVAEFLNNGLDEQYEIELKLADEAVKINGDKKLLLRAISNLVNNSIRHNPQGCKIILETFLSDDSSEFNFIVRDNGHGIPQWKLEEITELPYSSKRLQSLQQGHGLGLPMVASIMKAHHGLLVLQSDTNQSASDANQSGLKAILKFPVQP